MAELLHQPLYGVSCTVIIYVLALQVNKKWRWIHPLFVTSLTLIIIVYMSDSYDAYMIGGEMIVMLLGPATVALGVPIYKHFVIIKKKLLALIGGVTAGSVAGLASAGLTVYWLNGTKEVMLSMMPKSATTPIAVELVRSLGGLPALGAVFTVLTGLLGSMIGLTLLRWVGIKRGVAVGVAIGTAAHGIGTASLIREHEYEGSISAVAMGFCGMITSIAVIPLYGWFSG